MKDAYSVLEFIYGNFAATVYELQYLFGENTVIKIYVLTEILAIMAT